MDAKRCDRCGSFYVGPKTKIRFTDNDLPEYLEELDLCGSCENMIRLFLRDPEKVPVGRQEIERAVLTGFDKNGLLHRDELIDPIMDEIDTVYRDNSFGRYDIPY